MQVAILYALASGASQTGFGRTGTVDWQTGDIKHQTFTAVNGQGFFVIQMVELLQLIYLQVLLVQLYLFKIIEILLIQII